MTGTVQAPKFGAGSAGQEYLISPAERVREQRNSP